MDLGQGSTWALLYLLSEWIIRVAMLVVVPVRRSPEAAKGWLLLAFFLPWPALALYALIGRPTYPRWRRERAARFPSVLQLSAEGNSEHAPPTLVPEGLVQAITLVQNLGHLPPVPSNGVTF